MKIVMTANAAWNIWHFRQSVLEALLADGHDVTVLAPLDETAPKLEALGCRVRPLEMSVKGLNPVSDLALLARYRRLLREIRPDIILGYTIKNNIFGALAAKGLGMPFIPNVTGLGTAFLSGGALERIAVTLYRVAFRDLQVVFFQNADDREFFVERGLVNETSAQLLPGSGIDLTRFAPAPYPEEGTAPVFLMIARLLRDKGIFEYVEAARAVKRRHPQARFQVLGAVGSANRTAVDWETVREWEEDHLIEYLGTADDVRPIIEKAQCVVLPSYREGAPRTLIEAAAMARPLIATDVPGCRAVVEDGQTGVLCQPRDSESLAKACNRIIEAGYPARAAMGQAGRQKMERDYNERIVIEAYRDAIRACAQGQGIAA